jgi:peptidyl-prolyl cis-trans isomerase C
LLAELKQILVNQNLLEQLGKQVRDVPQPSAEEVRAYFDSHLDMFTVPEKLRLSVILLSVDPAAPQEEWDKVLGQAQGIYQQLQSGADFAELARQRSGDASAKEGGDLGYLHRGMLPPALHFEIDKLQVGVPSEPIKGLEGYSLFRLTERVPARQQEYTRGESRARELLQRERQEAAWKQNIERLRGAAKIEILVQPDDKK